MNKSIFMAVLVICLAGSTAFSQNTRAIIFQNDLGFTINGIYMEPTGVTTSVWGPNIYTLDTPLLTGGKYTYTQVIDDSYPGCLYDIKYTTSDGKEYYPKTIDVCKTSTVIFPAVKIK